MSYNGSGTFNINTSGQPVVTGTVISSTAFNALTADLGTGLSTAITKDGQTTATARIPFAQGINSSLVTDATSTTTGSIITAGGVGIAKALFVGTTANIAGTTTLAGVTATSITDSGLTSGRVTYAGTAGLLQDSANLTFSGSALVVTGTLSATGNISTSAGGDVGIGMTPVNVLDITKTQNAASRANLLNSNASGAASAAYRATNGNANMEILMLGTGFTTAGVNTANTGVVSASYDLALSYGGGGAASLKFAYGSTEKMRLDSSGIVTMNAYGAGAATFSSAGVISSVSDETWKVKDGAPVDTDAMLNKLEPGYWYYNDEKKDTFGADRQLGFYAQNVNAAIGPEAAPEPETFTTKNEDGTETITTKPWGYYDRSVLAVTVMSLQKALATIESLTARITALEAK